MKRVRTQKKENNRKEIKFENCHDTVANDCATCEYTTTYEKVQTFCNGICTSMKGYEGVHYLCNIFTDNPRKLPFFCSKFHVDQTKANNINITKNETDNSVIYTTLDNQRLLVRHSQTEKRRFLFHPKVFLFCFGFNLNSACDVVRMRSVHEKNPGYVCVPVSESDFKTTQEFPFAVSMNFATTRGFTNKKGELKAKVLAIQKHFPNSQLHAVLDYFWLENDYYKIRYGGRWVTSGVDEGPFKGSKVSILIEDLGFSRVSLPYDNGKRNKNNSHMQEVMANVEYQHYRYIKADKEPLWDATECKTVNEVLVENDRGNNKTQTDNYLPKNDEQFIVFEVETKKKRVFQSDGPRTRKKSSSTVQHNENSTLRLTSDYLVEGSYVFAFADTSYTNSLVQLCSKLGFNLIKLNGSMGWPRDEILIGSDGDKPVVFVPEPEDKALLSKIKSDLILQKTEYLKQKQKSHNKTIFKGKSLWNFLQKISGIIGGSGVFANSHEVVQSYVTELSNSNVIIRRFPFPIEGGQIIHQNGHVFVGEDSKILFKRIHPTLKFEDEFKKRFLVEPVVVPNIMWHLDLFWLVVKDNVAVLPMLSATDVIKRREKYLEEYKQNVPFTPVDKVFFDVMSTFQQELNDLQNVLMTNGIRVYLLDGFFTGGAPNKPLFKATFFNGMSGSYRDVPYVILPSFDKVYNEYFKQQLLEVERDLDVHFAGEVKMNTEQLRKHGGLLRCATAH